MTKREALRQTHLENALTGLGFTLAETAALRRISRTLHRWAEHECNGTIQREGESGDGAPYWYYDTPQGHRRGPKAPDRERGALRRLDAIMAAANARRYAATPDTLECIPLSTYIQGDPRGCALYILRPGDVPEGADPGSYYNRGIAVY